MWFKNLQLHRLPAPWKVSAEQIEKWLEPHAFQPANSVETTRQGWASPRNDGTLVYSTNKQLLLTFRAEKKLLPASVVTQVTKARALELEEQQGFKPGRKQMRDLKEQVTDELLPRAFSIQRDTRVWIDTVNGWLAIDSASQALGDDVLGLLVKSVDRLPIMSVRVAQAPVSAMTNWLLAGDGPVNFTLDRLAMTWNDRVSFVLTPSLTIKRVTPLDVIKDAADPTAQNDDEQFESDFTLMTGELAKMLDGIVDALGGELADGIAPAKAA